MLTVDWWRQTWSWYWLDLYSVIRFYNRLIIPPNTSPANICIHLYEEQLPQIARFTHVIKLRPAQSFSLAFIMLSLIFSLFLWWLLSRNIDLCFFFLVPETEKDSLCQVEGHRFVAFNQARNDGLGSVVSKPSAAREVNGSSDKLLHRCLGVNFMLSACQCFVQIYRWLPADTICSFL